MSGSLQRQDGVAVVVPCYNAEATLAETLESVIGQEGVVETIVVDDGSTDGSLAIARAFEPAVRVLTGPNRGVSAARNTGIAETSAPWILFLDSDDVLAPGTVATRLRIAAAAEGGADVVICDWQDLSEDTASAHPVISIDWDALRKDAEVAVASHVWATTAAILYRRDLVARTGGFRADLPVIQDARLLFDAAWHGARFVHAPHVGARYRVVQDSLSRRSPAGFWADVLLNGRQIEALWRDRGPLREDQRRVLAGIYDHAARGLLAAGDRRCLEAGRLQRALGLPPTRHNRLMSALAGVLGVGGARWVMRVIGRA